MNVLGNWLDGSGWVAVMAAAMVTTEGKADALQSGSLISRTQWAHQVTAAALLIYRCKHLLCTGKDSVQRIWKQNHLMSGVQIWRVIIHNFFTGAKPLNWKFVPPVYEITTSRKLFDVCGSARQYHTLDVWYGSFPLC